MHSKQNGTIIPTLLIITIFFTITVLSIGVISESNTNRTYRRINDLQAQYAAESGADIAIAFLNNGGVFSDSGVEKDLYVYGAKFKATYQSTLNDVAGMTNKKKIVSIGRVYVPATAATARYTYKNEVTLDRSSSSSSPGIISRNSIEIASSVKGIKSENIFANEYIRANKNTTDLTFKEMVIANKYPDATNCSLLGSGNLVKDSTLGSDKAKLTMTYSNCMDSTPGNSTDANFEVSANNTSITKVASTYLPWSYKMNNDDNGGNYANGNCSDLTSASPTIPSTGNNRKTHYPDSASGIVAASSCGGGSGLADISLGSKTITVRDHAHIRANLCKATSCRPTFINPDSGTVRFLFVEGVINFENVTVSSTSPGEIAFVSYSTNQAISASKQCPSNSAAIRLGKDGSNNVNAPKAYFIATNGHVCLDQTRFNTNANTLGGISGKDIYISSNSGSGNEINMDPNFPLASIPLDLSWRATTTKRLY